MAAVDGSIIIDTSLDNKGLEKDLKGVKSTVEKSTKTTKGLGEEFTKVGKKGKKAAQDVKSEFSELESAIGDLTTTLGLSFGLDSLINFGQTAINAASDLQEVQNVVDVAFGSMSEKANEFAANAKEQFGISELAAKQTAGTYMSMGKAMGLVDEQASYMSLSLTGLTGDMASFRNVSQEVASTALASIFTGETESLKQFGIAMTVANLEAFALSKGINKTWDELSQAEQVQLRYNYVMEQTAMMQGDYLRTQDSWANQNRDIKETINELQASIGSGLMDTLAPLQSILGNIVDSLLEFQESTGLLDDFFMVLVGGIAGLVAMKAADVIATIATKMLALGSATLIAKAQAGLAAVAIGSLIAVLIKLTESWKYMSDGEKIVATLGAVATAALAAAAAVGAFQSAVSLGVAAAGIAAGIAVIMAAIKSAEDRMKRNADINARLAEMQSIKTPGLATGAVIPANSEFLAILGDQKNGRNLEAPEGLIRQIVREESGNGGGDIDVSISFSGNMAQLGRVLEPVVTAERHRKGESLTEGGED